ncbi:hypothetical protein JF770_14960 [Mycobacterium intracellulare]|uniref:hypothetical protein n=1 Tax=Mycobacterium intracellulare TaxID=1767 RepID=UPI001CDA4CC8|nr:hypothetical protein [Mycobacterium intracellulare]MCA2304865.1 hypothetical protein [Mycobacterium intracellulare]MCA2347104.1 hypothetical protein [Mycobacterium intracellulare]
MPNTTAATRILRDDLLAQLRSAQRPLTTTQLRSHAPAVPVAGATVPHPPIQEQIYRVLCALERQGLAKRGSTHGREATWLPAPNPADHEIAALEAAFTHAATAQRVAHHDIARASEHLIAGARCAQQIAIDGDDHTAAAALSDVLIRCAGLLAQAPVGQGNAAEGREMP